MCPKYDKTPNLFPNFKWGERLHLHSDGVYELISEMSKDFENIFCMIIHIQNLTDLVSKPCKTRLVQTSYTTIQLEVAMLDQEVKRSHKKLQNEHCTILQ